MFTKWLNILLKQYRERKVRQQLKWQNLLTRKGIGIRTRILEIKEQSHPLADFIQFAILTQLRVHGKVVSRWVHTIIDSERTLRKGDTIHVRYNPSHLYNVLVL